MTLDEFVEELAQLGKGWRLTKGFYSSKIRRGDCCPISAFFDRPAGEVEECWKDLGLSLEDAKAIIHAADWCNGCDESLRQRLLKACSLA